VVRTWVTQGTLVDKTGNESWTHGGEIMAKMKAAIFVEAGRIVLDDKPVPDVGPLDALLRVTTTTICGTDIHILKGEYRFAKG